jgi:serine/threonine protein kinase
MERCPLAATLSLLLPQPEVVQYRQEGKSKKKQRVEQFCQDTTLHPTNSKDGLLYKNPHFPDEIAKTSPTATASRNLENEIQILTLLPECPYVVTLAAFSQPEQSYNVYDKGTRKEWRKPVGPFKPTYILLDQCEKDLYVHLRDCQSKPTTHDKWALQLLIAVLHLHTHNVHHLDIKPGNILIHGDGNIRLADFGDSVHLVDFDKEYKITPTGTVQYLMPSFTHASMNHYYLKCRDIYAMVHVFHELSVSSSPSPLWTNLRKQPSLTPIYTGSVQMLPAGEESCAPKDPYKVLYSRWMYALHDAFSTTFTTTPSYSTEARLEELWHHLFNEKDLLLQRDA